MSPKKRNIVIIVYWLIFILPIVFIISLFVLISNGKMGFMPSFEDLENPSSSLASDVISSDGIVLGSFFYQNRSRIEFDELSPNIVNAVTAIEDIRFRRHSGIDARGLGRVLVKTLLFGKSDSGGGSTITQQLAKNLFGRENLYHENVLKRTMNIGLIKFKEWVTAIRLERNYTKDEILVMYLNTVFYGSNSYGIKSASQTFFNKDPYLLKVEEAALLAGVVNAPTRYNPLRNPERAKVRRDIVLAQMNKYGFISDSEFDSLAASPITLDYNTMDHNFGLAAYVREYIRLKITANEPVRKNYFNYQSFVSDSIEWVNNPLYGWVNKHTKPDGSHYNLYADGLRIHTTINSRLQSYAEEAVYKHIGKDIQPNFFAQKRNDPNAPFSNDLTGEQVRTIIESSIKNTNRYRHLRKNGITSWKKIMENFETPVKMTVFSWQGEKDTVMSPLDSILYYKHLLRAGFISIEPNTGHIKSYVGGPDFKYFKFDHVIRSRRQVGSTIKPFLYTLAMQEGYSPCHKVPNVPQTFIVGDTTWTPRNSGNSVYDGQFVTLRWGLSNSVNNISAWLVKQFTPPSVVDIMRKMGITGDIPAVPSLVLGTPEISLYEMVGAYCTYVNKGVYISPILVTRIEDKTGVVLTEFKTHKEEAFGEETAYKMLNLLQGVVNEGTGIRLRLKYQLYSQIGGKTGTSQNQSDGWFIGVTPNLVSGVWVGGEFRSIHFNNIAFGQGANTALPIWALYMKSVYADDKIPVTSSDSFNISDNFYLPENCDHVFRSSEQSPYRIIEENW